MGSYYSALTSVCALGERILNHLLLELRDDFKGTEQYKTVFRKSSFDDWTLAINTLAAWEVLLPSVEVAYRELMDRRHKALHFRPETDHNDRTMALEAMLCFQEIIREQFSGFGSQPWFLDVPGESYLKKEWEQKPFIKRVYIPNGIPVGPQHRIVRILPPPIALEDIEYSQCEISDDEYVALRKQFMSSKPVS